jgi:hypothetical protein
MSERFSFHRHDLDVLESFFNPLLDTRYYLEEGGLWFNSNVDSVNSVGGEGFLFGFGFARANIDGLVPDEPGYFDIDENTLQ